MKRERTMTHPRLIRVLAAVVGLGLVWAAAPGGVAAEGQRGAGAGGAAPAAAGPQGALDTHKASVISYLTVFHRMAAATGAQATPEEGWPDNTYSIAQKRLYFNDEPVVITHFVGNDDGNSVVLFRKSDVVA